MSDEMIVALAKNGGVIQINFGSTFVNQVPAITATHAWRPASSISPRTRNSPRPSCTADTRRSTRRARTAAVRHVDDVLDHFDHVVKLTSVEHVGIGSDFDGVGDSLPIGLKDVSSYPNLVEGLLKRGYSEEDIRKILGENLLRVWEAVEAYAATTSSST